MATLVLGTVGRAIGGPIGGIVGSLAGSVIDRGLFGGARGRAEVPLVQSAAYGEPVPRVFGRMRVAGNLIWSSEIAEQASAGGKGGGYSYSASFAVGLSARRLTGVGRIWADGRLLRDGEGRWLLPVVMRLHLGDEDQPIDVLMAAAEGDCPAYAGLAYAVFEDLPLADFGNRIPGLNFEVIADTGLLLDLGGAARELCEGRISVEGDFAGVDGMVAAQPGRIADTLDLLLDSTDAALVDDQGRLVMRIPAGTPEILRLADCRSSDAAGRSAPTRRRLAASTAVDSIEIGFVDPERDFQPGLQRVQRSAGHRIETLSLPVAMTPMAAKALAASRLAQRHAARLTRSVRLPWRHLGIMPGAVVRTEDSDAVWRVRERLFEGFLLTLSLERMAAPVGVAVASDGGRAPAGRAEPMGPTVLHLLDLPSLGPVADMAPRLLVAGAGAGPGWRRAPVLVSDNGGLDYAAAGTIAQASMMGIAINALPAGHATIWNRSTCLEVELIADGMWLQGLPEAAVLQGGNLALVGDELVQFAQAEAIAPRRFRLRGLLRGRRGTEAAIGGHRAGERFIMLESAALLPLDHALDRIGQSLLVRPAGGDDADAAAMAAVVGGRGLRPLAPVHLRARPMGDGWQLTWVRRSRAGFGWADFVDVPLAEAFEAWTIEVWSGDRLCRTSMSETSGFDYGAAEQIADGCGETLIFRVAQLSEAVGPGEFAELAVTRRP
ncbi:hypothetical protein FHS79_000783 [Polymorphobacter multimanifer]|uniref:Tip attachment protein J domain-containing protein n=1 Tax=Polymorphobacter multimanifer TaxID=1070431 RepID=A0A841L9V7_9SPHN|nr:phage tail protein [Polymorphobacter multimanifer]MBB6226625.1 hypothetical protein [Polymorphobacter multimanifer]